MSVFSNAVADWEGSGYGSLIACPSVLPSLPGIPCRALHTGKFCCAAISTYVNDKCDTRGFRHPSSANVGLICRC